jgi:hypothetical protein
MTALRVWLLFVGGLVCTALMGAPVLVLAGRPDLVPMMLRLAVVLSAIGLLFSALMVAIIVWAHVRTARLLGQRPPRVLHGDQSVVSGAVRFIQRGH